MTTNTAISALLTMLAGSSAVALSACPGDDCTRTATCAFEADGGGGIGPGGVTGGGGAATGGGNQGGETSAGGGGESSSDPPRITAGGDNTCYVSGSTLRCWGDNATKQLAADSPGSSATPLTVQLPGGVQDVAIGSHHVCALLTDGTVWCWGQGDQGELGNGSQGSALGVADPVKVLTLEGATAIEAGSDHTCVILNDGSAKCWGSNAAGQLGDGSTMSNASTPVDLAIGGLEKLADGATCAVVMGGSLWCWGDGSPQPTQVPGISNVVDACRGNGHTCAVTMSGEVFCWGDFDENQLGFEADPQGFYPSPTQPVINLAGAVELTCGDNFTCARLDNSTLRCWGDPMYSGNGVGDSTGEPYEPETPLGLDSAVAISAGSRHGCALRSTQDMWCWGENGFGQVGISGSAEEFAPVEVQGL